MKQVWNNVLSKPFSAKDGDSAIWAMAEFGGELYVGAGRSGTVTSANVYRLTHDGCKKWDKVTPPWSSATGEMAMAVFKNQLYVGTDQGEVWRAADGESWYNTTGNLPSVGQIDAMAEFKGYLHISAGTTIWRTLDGSSWKLVINLSTKDPKIYDIRSLEVFNNHLYAGIGLKNPVYVNTPQGKVLVNKKGIRIWRTADGKNWSMFKEVVEPLGYLGVKFYPEHVHALKAFKGYLYVGEYHGHGLYRTDGSATSWDYIPDAISEGTGSSFRLMEHAGKLYLGASHLAPPDAPGVPGTHLLFTSTNGTKWKPVSGRVVDNDHSSVTSLLSHGGRLYVGTLNPSKSGSVALLELGPEIVPDQFEPNNTFTTATALKLGSTKTQTLAELTDLTLLDNDVDFFKIEYQSKPEHKYFSPFKKELEAGIIVEINPGFLSILVQEEYCRPLIFEIYDSKKKLRGKFHTADTVEFTGPDLYFEDQKLFLAVKNPDGKPPVRYKLSVKLSGWQGTLGRPLYEFRKYTPPWGLPKDLLWPWVPEIPPRPEPPGPLTYFDFGQLVADSEKYLSEFIEYRSKIEKADLEHGLGQIAHLGEQYDDAERFYRQSLTAFQELEITAREAEVLRSLGELYSAQGKAEEALESFESAYQLHEKLEKPLGLAHDRMSLGRHYLAEGEASKSLAALEEAFGFQGGTVDMSGRVLNLLYQSEAFLALNQQEATVACLILAGDLSSRLGDPTISREVDRLTELVSVKVDEQEFLVLKERFRQAETVRHRAMSKITGKLP